jgi:hypothetical protein
MLGGGDSMTPCKLFGILLLGGLTAVAVPAAADPAPRPGPYRGRDGHYARVYRPAYHHYYRPYRDAYYYRYRPYYYGPGPYYYSAPYPAYYYGYPSPYYYDGYYYDGYRPHFGFYLRLGRR